MLTREDLLKIDELLDIKLKDFATKADIEEARQERMELKDMLVGIRNELDTEHEVRAYRIEENSKRIGNHEERIGYLESLE